MFAPKKLPLIDRTEIIDSDGAYRLNPFRIGKLTYRIIGAGQDEETGKFYQIIKCVETGEYKNKFDDWMLKAAKKK